MSCDAGSVSVKGQQPAEQKGRSTKAVAANPVQTLTEKVGQQRPPGIGERGFLALSREVGRHPRSALTGVESARPGPSLPCPQLWCHGPQLGGQQIHLCSRDVRGFHYIRQTGQGTQA